MLSGIGSEIIRLFSVEEVGADCRRRSHRCAAVEVEMSAAVHRSGNHSVYDARPVTVRASFGLSWAMRMAVRTSPALPAVFKARQKRFSVAFEQ